MWGSVPPFSGTTTPVRAGMGGGIRAYENTIMAAMRKQMELLEEKMNAQINRSAVQNERLREASNSRFEAKIAASEGMQPKLDRKLAELSGNIKGLTDEMQSQIRRIDAMDSRLWEWRHEMEEHWRQKSAEIEQNVQVMTSANRVAAANSEDQQKRLNQRLRRLEVNIEERLQQSEVAHDNVMHLEARVEALEAQRGESLNFLADKKTSPGTAETVQSPAQWQLEQQLADCAEKVEQLTQTSLEAQARVEEHEVRITSMRSKLDSQEQHYRWLGDRVERADWESRFEQIRVSLNDESRKLQETADRVQVGSKKSAVQEQALEELVEQVRGLHEQIFCGGMPNSARQEAPSPAFAGSEMSGAMQDVTSKLEQRLEVIDAELSSLRTDSLAPRVGALVAQLTEVVPKVVEHEREMRDVNREIKDLNDKVSRLGSGVPMSPASAQKIGALPGRFDDHTSATSNRIDALEAKLGQIKIDEFAATITQLRNDLIGCVSKGELTAVCEEVKRLEKSIYGSTETMNTNLKEIRNIHQDTGVLRTKVQEMILDVQKMSASKAPMAPSSPAGGGSSAQAAEALQKVVVLEGKLTDCANRLEVSNLQNSIRSFEKSVSATSEHVRSNILKVQDIQKDNEGLRNQVRDMVASVKELSSKVPSAPSSPTAGGTAGQATVALEKVLALEKSFKDTAGKMDSLEKSILDVSGKASDLSSRLTPCEKAVADAKRCGEEARDKVELVEKSCNALSDLASRLDTTEALEKVELKLLEKFESSVLSMKDKVELLEKSVANGATKGADLASRLDMTEALEKTELQILEKVESSVLSMKGKLELLEKFMSNVGQSKGQESDTADSAAFARMERTIEQMEKQQGAARQKLEAEVQKQSSAVAGLAVNFEALEKGLSVTKEAIRAAEAATAAFQNENDSGMEMLSSKFDVLTRGLLDVRKAVAATVQIPVAAAPADPPPPTAPPPGVPPPAGAPVGINEALSKQLTNLVKSVEESESQEKEVHDRLLKRIDELCTRLVAVDGAIAAEGSSKINDEWKALVRRVEETENRSGEIQTQIQNRLAEMGKVVELVSKLSKEASGGNQE